ERVLEHRLDVQPRHPGRVVLQPAQLSDELRRQQVPPGGEHLAELDERDTAVLEREPERAGKRGPPVRGGQLRPAGAAQVREQSVAGEYPADLRVTARPAAQPARAAQDV